MTKYRKKPVVIEAMVLDGTEQRLHEISRWMTNGSDAFDAFEVGYRAAFAAFEQAHTPTSDEPEQTEFYEVMGGQGLMRIAKNLTREQAEEVREKFDRDCHRYGLMNPPTRINKQHGRY